MENAVISSILPLVKKPGRYVGYEMGSIKKDHAGRVKFCLCFPDLYEIGMSNLGLQIIYHLINRRDDALCERAFSVDTDMERKLRESNQPLCSIESFTPLSEFDIVGFSIGYELAYPSVLDMLALAGIPLYGRERSDDDPIIIAGGPAILNPEPLSDFIDLFFIGDGEEAVDEFIDTIKSENYKQADRRRRLRLLADIAGSYLPSFYEGRKPKIEGIPGTIKIRSIRKLENEYYPALPIIPNFGTVHDRLTVELMRGCVRGCRFCQAGYQYRPKRERPADDIITQVKESLRLTGYEEVSLQSLSSTDYSELESLIKQLNYSLSGERISIAIPSLRPGTLSLETLNSLNSGRKTGLTFAPEAGTQRLRDVINKDVTEEEILSTSEMVFANGWNHIKLYFMIGLPTETEEDIRAIVRLIRKIESISRDIGGKRTIGVTISPFVPKPLTPFQWERQADLEEILAKYAIIRGGLRSKYIELRFHHAEHSIIEGVLSRAGKNIGKVLHEVHKSGLRLQTWTEHFQYEKWLEIFDRVGFDYKEILAGYGYDDPLPWSHVNKGIGHEYFRREREKAFSDQPSAVRKKPAEERAEPGSKKSGSDVSYGRRCRAVKSKPAIQLPESTVRLRWSRDERMRFLSHRDMIRLFQRAIRRAGIPVEYSQGFSPHQKLSFGPPLPVGYTSEDEYMDIRLTEPLQNGMLIDLRKSLPEGISVGDAVSRPGFMNSLSTLINMHEYMVTPPELSGVEGNPKIPDAIIITRVKENKESEIDIRPGLHEMEIVDDSRIRLAIIIDRDGVGRPEEYLSSLLDIDESKARISCIHRIRQYSFRDNIKHSVFDVSS